MENKNSNEETSTPPTTISSTAFGAPPSGLVCLQCSQRLGLSSRVGTVFVGALTLGMQLAFLLVLGNKLPKAIDVLIETGRWIPATVLIVAMMPVAAPLAFGRVKDAGAAIVTAWKAAGR